ncbi:MAG: O-methyltransferase [Pseudobutyrivibrio sp.]|nr:O-methyltransferase [Pseudobutyrivibrio sp.]
MIVDERYTTYLNSLYPELNEDLDNIRREARANYVPIIRDETMNLLTTLIRMNRPKRILEVGAAVGFSACLMASVVGPDTPIVTIENYEPRIPIATNNIKNMGFENQITLIEGDATQVLKELEGPFDFVFMDAAKGQYINFWPEIKRLTADGGIIVTDNVLQDGDIIESRYAITRRNRTIHKRMRDYLFELTHDEGYTTTILPLGDGVSISVKGKK